MEDQVHREMGDLTREVRAALAELREQRPQLAERPPWSLDNVVRLHNELRAEPQASGGNAGLALQQSFGGSAALALDPRPETLRTLAPTVVETLQHAPSDHLPFWRQASTRALAITMPSSLPLDSVLLVRAGRLSPCRRACGGGRTHAAQARTEAGREMSVVRQQAHERVASAEEAGSSCPDARIDLAASDLQRFDMTAGAAGRRAGQVLWSRTGGRGVQRPPPRCPAAGPHISAVAIDTGDGDERRPALSSVRTCALTSRLPPRPCCRGPSSARASPLSRSPAPRIRRVRSTCVHTSATLFRLRSSEPLREGGVGIHSRHDARSALLNVEPEPQVRRTPRLPTRPAQTAAARTCPRTARTSPPSGRVFLARPAGRDP